MILTKNNKNGWMLLDWITYLHLKFHHVDTKKHICDSSMCAYRGKIFKKVGDIPYISLKK
jgi:hypothetical protein